MAITSSSTVTPIAINATNQLPVKLTATNFASWKAQFYALLCGFDLSSYVDVSFPAPPMTIEVDGKAMLNSAYSFWLRQDKLILHAIIASTSEAIIPFISSATTSREAWATLLQAYANRNRSRVISLKEKLFSTRQNNRFVGEFLQQMKQITDEIRLTGTSVDDDDLVLHVLRGLISEFCEIVAVIRVRETPVSFEQLHNLCYTELLEIAWGLANSNQPFLWVVRPGSVLGSEWLEPLPEGFLEMVDKRGHIVKWAPQLQVLAHPTIGGFWTHCGWNSTLESLCEGVPMICQPFFADQPINARLVCDVWKVGVHLEDTIDRGEIEKAIRSLMVEEQGQEMRDRIKVLKENVNLCFQPGGSSYKSLDNLVTYISSLHV